MRTVWLPGRKQRVVLADLADAERFAEKFGGVVDEEEVELS